MLHVDLTFLVLTCFRVLADYSRLTFLYFVISDYLPIEPLLVDYDFCLALLNLGFCTLCIWVPPSLSLPFTIYKMYSIFLLITALGYFPHVILIDELGYIMPIGISCLEIPVMFHNLHK